jgi:teichoic acid transport system permease protein
MRRKPGELKRPSEEGVNVLLQVGVTPSVGHYLRRLWRRRYFIWAFPLGQLKAQTQSTLLGVFWHLLSPALTAAVYYLVFGVLFGADRNVENYPAFLIVGIFTYIYTHRSLAAGAKAIRSNIGLVTQINFPRLALPLATIVAETLTHLFAVIALFAVLFPVLGVPPSLAWFNVLPALILQAGFNLGAALVLARLAFQYRDLENLLPHLLRFWMYGSGVFYSLELVREASRGSVWVTAIFEANPLYIYITLMRAAVLGSGAGMWLWLAALAWTVASVVIGFLFFRAREVAYGQG